MKTINKYTHKIKVTVLIAILSLFSAVGFSQPPPPPGGSSGPSEGGGSGNELGGSAPIGGGLFILLGLGAVYGGKKLYRLREKPTDYTD